MGERLNAAFKPFGLQSRDLPAEFSFFVFSLIASIISFSLVKIQLRFAYYFFNFTSSNSVDDEDDGIPTQENMDEAEQIVAEKYN